MPNSYWSQTTTDLLTQLQSSDRGLSSSAAAACLKQVGPNSLKAARRASVLGLLLNQFKSPLVLILIVATIISAFVGEYTDALITLVILLSSALLSFTQEYRANTAMEELRKRVTLKANVLRDGTVQSISTDQIVPGDVVELSAGSLIPADGVLLEAHDLYANQAVLTGETFPVEKKPGETPAAVALAERTNCVYMGTSISTGTGRALIVQTGTSTEFGKIAEKLTLRPPETEFERGTRQFGALLMQVTLLLVFAVFVFNVVQHKPALDSLLFSVALAVGIVPELLPAIISITLSRGARAMADHGVIVRRLTSIENFGNMDTLCTDKTGTLTAGVVKLDGALDVHGTPSQKVLGYAYLNARFQTGLANPLDAAILAQEPPQLDGIVKTDEVPYDFARKRLSVVVSQDGTSPTATYMMITKGALDNVLDASVSVCDGGNILPLDAAQRASIQQRLQKWSAQGFRVLGVATKTVDKPRGFSRDDEHGMTFEGFLLFFDPPKPGVNQSVKDLAHLGVQLKMITGDNALVAQHVAESIGLEVTGVLTGQQLNAMRDEALWHAADKTNLFVQVDPNQKERILLALKKMGHVVGYLGDGINDAPALHAADVSISVENAVDVAKEAADFVLLKPDLDILRQGILLGRTTFANTIKYVFTTTSANFGNMFSMAATSLFLPFLPLLPKQVLLNNFLADGPELTIATDNVDADWVNRPLRWNIHFIRSFMVVFGILSSAFDFITFGTMLFLVHAPIAEFRTGWFLESLLTQSTLIFVVRTRKAFFQSRPGHYLLLSTLVVDIIALWLPYSPFSASLGFVPLPLNLLGLVLLITGLYVMATEIAKRMFYQHFRL